MKWEEIEAVNTDDTWTKFDSEEMRGVSGTVVIL